MFYSEFSLSILIFTLIFLITFIIRFLFIYVFYKKPYKYQKGKKKTGTDLYQTIPISIVIASKNESENLAQNLPMILAQNYPHFEVIVVNMGSTDETDTVLKQFANNYSYLYHTYVPASAGNTNEKKLALTLGIKAAKFDYILFTEANCTPISDNWLYTFAEEFQNGNDIVLGYSRLLLKKRTLFRKYMEYENMFQGIRYLSAALFGRTYMGMNRNLAYRKKLFFEEKGFASVLGFEGGEDDLFINKIAKGRKVGVAVSSESHTQITDVENWTDWIKLQSKYIANQRFYKNPMKMFFVIDSLSKYIFALLFLCGIIWGAINLEIEYIIISCLFLIVQLFFLINVFNKNGNIFSVRLFHIDIFFYQLIQPTIYFFNKIRSRNKRKR